MSFLIGGALVCFAIAAVVIVVDFLWISFEKAILFLARRNSRDRSH